MLSVVDNIGELTDPVAKDNDASLLGELLVNLNMAMVIDEESQVFDSGRPRIKNLILLIILLHAKKMRVFYKTVTQVTDYSNF